MKLIWLVAVVILVGGFIYWKDVTGTEVKAMNSSSQKKEKKKDKKKNEQPSPGINITQQWDLPADLKEVSGIAYVDNDRVACIQDEQGTIFIYNKPLKKIEKTIPFASPGDFEDISLVGNTAWVVRADGRLFEVDMNGSKKANEYATALTVEQNIEGLAHDKTNNRLLLSVKDGGKGKEDDKEIFAFDLSTKTLATQPVFRVSNTDKNLNAGSGKKPKAVRPSAIGIHPSTGEIYITDGPQRRLLVMDATGTIKNVFSLGKSFEQPEGITFSPQGELFISNEGTEGPGNILQVSLEK